MPGVTHLIAFFFLCGISLSAASSIVMPWFCLQRCGYSVPQIEIQLETILRHNDESRRAVGVPIVNVASFERYNLDANSTLHYNSDLFDMNAVLQKKAPSIKRIAMVSSYPYPPAFLDWMRELFAKPYKFIEELAKDLRAANISGVNIDFEPSVGNPTAADAEDYAKFLGLLRRSLWLSGELEVSVDVSRWSGIWNISEIADALGKPDVVLIADLLKPKTEEQAFLRDLWRRYGNGTTSSRSGRVTVGKGTVATMNTYTYITSVFLQQLSEMYAIFYDTDTKEPKKDVAEWYVGLQTWISNKSYTGKEVEERFDALRERGLCKIAIWDTPFQDFWWPILENFTKLCM